jgi:hypothetical protein
MTPEAYRDFAAKVAGSPKMIAIRKEPGGLRPDARYRYNFVVGGFNRGWILDGDDDPGYVLYLDWNGTGERG